MTPARGFEHLALEDPRAERARHELHRQPRRLVLAVEDRVHLHDLERPGEPDSATSSIARCASR